MTTDSSNTQARAGGLASVIPASPAAPPATRAAASDALLLAAAVLDGHGDPTLSTPP